MGPSDLPSCDPPPLLRPGLRSGAQVGSTIHRFVVDYLIRVRARVLAEDFDALVLWGVLTHHQAAQPETAMGLDGQRLDGLRQGDLARITGIPRETVRRKLLRLEAAGWILRAPRGWVIHPQRSAQALETVSRDWSQRFVHTAGEISRLGGAG